MKRKLYQWTVFIGIAMSLLFMVACQIIVPTIIEESKMKWQGPDSGLWYCKELEIQLCFQPNVADNKESSLIDSQSYVLIDDDCIMCDILKHEGTYSLCVINQDIATGASLGNKLFEGKFVSLDEDSYVVSDENGEAYIFKRLEEFSMQEKLTGYKNQIPQYCGIKNVGNVKHVAIAIQKSKELWQSELKIDITDYETVTTAYDLETGCWFVSTSSQFSLIDTEGNVIGVWANEEQHKGSLS